MDKLHNPSLTHISRVLRRNMTKEEKHLWYDFLRRSKVGFKRQKIIGDYVVDFYCPAAKLVIELDGSQHYRDKNRENDKKRDEYLKSLGMAILRYPNSDIKTNFSGVCSHINHHLRLLLPDETL